MATRYNSITFSTLLCDLGAWGKRLQYFAFVINGTSQVVRLAVNLHEHFIQVPLPIGVCAGAGYVFCGFLQQKSAQIGPPESNRFMADVDAALVQQVLNIPERKREPDIHHDRRAMNFRAAVEILERAAFCHGETLRNRTSCFKANPSDTASPGYSQKKREGRKSRPSALLRSCRPRRRPGPVVSDGHDGGHFDLDLEFLAGEAGYDQ